jgi:hypothetical protein
MHADQRLSRIGRLEEGVSTRCHLAEAPPDRKDEIRVAKTHCERVIHRDAENPDVTRRAVVDEVLAAERACDG